MRILAIETTGAKASVAIIHDNGQVCAERSDDRMNHLQHLMPMIKSVVEKDGGVKELTHIAVSEGPGSFTGIRIGMATAKALSQTLNLPMIGVPTLRSFALSLQEPKQVICPIFDARRNQIYAGAYYWDENRELHTLVEDGAYDLETFLFEVDDKASEGYSIVLFGDGIDAYGDKISGYKLRHGFRYAEPDKRYQDARFIAEMAKSKCEKGQVTTYSEIKPVYLRKAEAERKLEERLEAENSAKELNRDDM